MRLSILGLFGVLLAIANVVAVFLRFPEQGINDCWEILVVVVYAVILLLTSNSYEEEPGNNTLKKWIIGLFVAAIINIISIILAPREMITSNFIYFILFFPFVSLIAGCLLTFLLIRG